MREKCGGTCKGFRCCGERGHKGLHTFYDYTKDSVVLYEWNNGGETLPENWMQFNSFPCDFDKGEQERKRIMTLAIKDAKENLAKGTIFEVRAKGYPFEGKAESARVAQTKRERAKDWGIAWYCVRGLPKGFEDMETAKEPLFACDSTEKGKVNVLGGYVLMARIKA